MQTILRNFTTKHLFDASADMLSHLKIMFTPQTKTPIPFEVLYTSATNSPLTMSLSAVLKKVRESFFIGTIDEDSLAGRNSDFDLQHNVEAKYQTMLVFAVEINAGESLSRTELATITRGFNRMASSLPVIVFIKNDNFLSLATCERSQYRQNWRDGEKLGKVAILRNINCNKVHRGHIDILESLGDKAYPTFDDLYDHWLDVFSSELLTRKFYTELAEWYAWVIGSGKVKFPNDINTTDDDAKFNHESVIRLITRLIFVWFLKQKKLIPNEFFDEKFIREHFIANFNPHSKNSLSYNPEQSKYYRLILQNLFFAMLNRPIMDEESGNDENRRFVTENRYQGKSQDYNINNLLRYKSEFAPGGADLLLKIANSTVPFLNGGLFECLDDKDNGKYYDGFSERKASLEQLSFPDYFFFGDEVGSDVDLSAWYDDKKKVHTKVRGLIDILRRYNFTVEENTPLDQEVSLDPELLGKVFENLLASYNPETKATARKQTGSFYTPREIVQYMVDESLIEHLCRICGVENKERYRSLLSYSTDDTDFTDKEKDSVIEALHSCKVLDPACGSGAFPMGILQQMVHALRKLDPTNEKWKEFILKISLDKDNKANQVEDEIERNRLRADIDQAFNNSINDPDYARKLYLIENCIYGVDIQPIAIQISKLRFFISLVAEQKPTNNSKSNFDIRPLPNLETKFVSADSLMPLTLSLNVWTSTEKIKNIEEALAETNHKLFRAKRNAAKKLLRKKISDLREQYADILKELGAFSDNSAKMLSSWDVFDQNISAPFFDAKWMFDISDGFDIVIGNPPYRQIPKGKYPPTIFKYSEGKDIGKQNLYKLFVEHSYNMLKDNGVACMIVQSSLMCDMSAKHTRELLLKHTTIKYFIEFPKTAPTKAGQLFASVCQGTCIYLFVKNIPNNDSFYISIGNDRTTVSKIQGTFVAQEEVLKDFPKRYEIPLIKNGEIELITKIKHFPTLKSIITKTLQGNINTIHLKRIQSPTPSIFRIAKGANIHRFFIDDNLLHGKNTEEVFQLSNDNAKAGAVIVTQNITGTVDKYRIHAAIAECKNTRIVFLHSVNVLHLPSPRFALIALSCLNSILLDWLFRKTSTNNHCNMYELEDLPIPSVESIPEKFYSEIESLILERPIDEIKLNLIVDKLYNLTYDEVLIIDPKTPITREEYENYK